MAITRGKGPRKGTPVPPPIEPSDAQKQIFLEAFAEDFCVSDARRAARMSRAMLNGLLEKDPAFVEAMREITEDSVDRVEAAAFRRAVNFGDKDLIKLILQNKRAKDYGAKANVTVSLTPEQVAAMSDDEIEHMYKKLGGR
jgi:succinate dehydrogenase flavin-adding protein (antitoxin of CptAB toxin-antitoxin module)